MRTGHFILTFIPPMSEAKVTRASDGLAEVCPSGTELSRTHDTVTWEIKFEDMDRLRALHRSWLEDLIVLFPMWITGQLTLTFLLRISEEKVNRATTDLGEVYSSVTELSRMDHAVT